MKKFAALALSCILAVGLFAGCRRNVGNETAAPTPNPTSNTTEHTTGTKPHTQPSTQPETHNTTVPSVIPDTSDAIDGTDGMDRSRRIPPMR